MKGLPVVTASVLALAVAAPAAAQTYREALDLPAYGSRGPRVLQSTGSFTTGTKLTAASEISNPLYWNNAFNVFLDTTAQTITLTGDGENTYQTIDFDLTGVTGLTFTGLTAVTPFGATAPARGAYDFTTSFTASSLHISYALANIVEGNYFEINQGSSVFSYTTGAVSAAVPEPATWGMMLLGFGAMGYAMRRRTKVRTNISFA